jgi:hypothetical protein
LVDLALDERVETEKNITIDERVKNSGFVSKSMLKVYFLLKNRNNSTKDAKPAIVSDFAEKTLCSLVYGRLTGAEQKIIGERENMPAHKMTFYNAVFGGALTIAAYFGAGEGTSKSFELVNLSKISFLPAYAGIVSSCWVLATDSARAVYSLAAKKPIASMGPIDMLINMPTYAKRINNYCRRNNKTQ